jgi:hypothetical protein
MCSEAWRSDDRLVHLGVVMPAIVAGGGWIVALAHDSYLRRQEGRRTRPAE